MVFEIVLCPNCRRCFPTEKKDPQCGKCGKRFYAASNTAASSKLQNQKERARQIKRVDELLAKISDEYKEAGMTIRDMRKVAKESLRK